METTEQIKEKKLYYDAGKFKGNTFENNINTINKLYLGIGLKITDIPYIYVDEKDNKTYLAANRFMIKTTSQKNDSMINAKKEEKITNYPISFIYRVFFHNNIIFYLDQKNNELNVYKLNKNDLTVKKCVIHGKIRQKDSQKDAQKKYNKNKKDENDKMQTNMNSNNLNNEQDANSNAIQTQKENENTYFKL